jgi:NADH-quinone oxidoreductase subunit M
LVGGWALLPSGGVLPIALCLLALLLRTGIWPLHGWFTELFEGASLGVALPLVLSFGGVLALIRLVLPIAPESLLALGSSAALITAVYGGGLALVTREYFKGRGVVSPPLSVCGSQPPLPLQGSASSFGH